MIFDPKDDLEGQKCQLLVLCLKPSVLILTMAYFLMEFFFPCLHDYNSNTYIYHLHYHSK